MEVNNENESDRMKIVEKQRNPKVMNLNIKTFQF